MAGTNALPRKRLGHRARMAWWRAFPGDGARGSGLRFAERWPCATVAAVFPAVPTRASCTGTTFSTGCTGAKLHEPLTARAREVGPSAIAVTAITLAEMWFGAAKSHQPRRTRTDQDGFLVPSVSLISMQPLPIAMPHSRPSDRERPPHRRPGPPRRCHSTGKPADCGHQQRSRVCTCAWVEGGGLDGGSLPSSLACGDGRALLRSPGFIPAES